MSLFGMLGSAIGGAIAFYLGVRRAQRVEADRTIRILEAIRKELRVPADDWLRALDAAKWAGK